MKNTMNQNTEYEVKKKQIKELLNEFDVYMHNVCYTSTDEHVSLYEHWRELISSIDDVLNYTPEQLCDMYKRTARLENNTVINNLQPMTPLYQIYKQTDIEYVVYLAPSLDGKTVEEASLEAGRKLGIGNKEDNTGLLIYVALADREFRMEVGYGLEGVIPDSQAKRIIDCMTSYFKNENYADGLLAAVTKTVEILNDSGEYTISQDENYVVETGTDDDDLLVGMIVVIVFIVVLCVISAFVDGGSGSLSSGRYYSSGYRSSSSSSGSFGGGSFGGGGASGGW